MVAMACGVGGLSTGGAARKCTAVVWSVVGCLPHLAAWSLSAHNGIFALAHTRTSAFPYATALVDVGTTILPVDFVVVSQLHVHGLPATAKRIL